MQVHPTIARLRGEVAPQPCTDAAVAAWCAGPQMAAITAALARYSAGEPLAALPDLTRQVDNHAAASALVQGLVNPIIAALCQEPLAHLTFTHSATSGFVRLRLAQSGGAALTLAAYALRPPITPTSALFEDCEAHEIVVAGEGRALFHRLTAEQLHSTDITCNPATRVTRLGPDTARQFIAITRPLLVLQLTREPLRPGPSREIALADGALLKTISGCKRTSQQMMALAVLGALGHHRALGELTRLAQDRSADRDLRWEALRQGLAMDAPRGLALLAALACADGDPLSAPAASLRRDVLAKRPDLAALIAEPA